MTNYDLPQRVSVVFPRLGETVTEGTVDRWIKQEGDLVAADEPLVEVTTDKVNAEIPAPFAGRLAAILVAEGATVAVGAELAQIELEPTAQRPREVDVTSPPVSSTDSESTRSRKEDDDSQIQIQDHRVAELPLPEIEDTDSSIRVTPMRRSIADHMVRSVSTIPHAWTVREIDMTPIVRYREKVNVEFTARYGFPFSYQVPIIQALCASLSRHPLLNSRWAVAKIVLRGRIHLGIAVAVPGGVVVPVIRDAHAMSFLNLAFALNDVVSRARERRLSAADMQGATFTLNNPGANGAVLSYSIIPYGQCAILTTQTITPTPVVRQGDVTIREMMNVCLSFDHRIMDGADAGAFLQDLRAQLEEWTPAGV